MSTKIQQDSKRIRNRKRILSVTVRRMVDDSPDTSYLGEFSNREETEYAIDRAHSEDCASIQPREFSSDGEWKYWNGPAEDILERIELSIGLPFEATDGEYPPEINDAIYTLQDCAKQFECDCGFSGHWDAREYRYFNGPVENYKGLTPEEIRKYIRQDYDRMQSLYAGRWCYLGIRAEAEVILNVQTDGPGRWHGVTHKITSGGLWGIESDSDRSYIAETEQGELANLREELLAAGFSRRAIAQAFKDVQEVDS